jgi:hypothetical protein
MVGKCTIFTRFRYTFSLHEFVSCSGGAVSATMAHPPFVPRGTYAPLWLVAPVPLLAAYAAYAPWAESVSPAPALAAALVALAALASPLAVV